MVSNMSPARPSSNGSFTSRSGGPASTMQDASRALSQALSELEQVKAQLLQPELSKEQIKSSLDRIENGLKKQSEDLAMASWSANRSVEPELMQHIKATSQILGVRFRSRPLPHVVQQREHKEQLAAHKANFLEKPQSEAARQYLQARFGVSAPVKPQAADRPAVSASGSLLRGLTGPASAGLILPRHLRDDPHALPPPAACDAEMDKGLLHLTNRGLLPARMDLTPALSGQSGLMASGVALHQYSDQFHRPPPTSALEDSLIAQGANNFKLDLLTPVVKPPPTAHKSVALHIAAIGAHGALGPLVQSAELSDVDLSADPAAAPSASTAAEDEASRPYDVLMDAFSLHEIMIRKGSTIRSTPEFASFQRSYSNVWGVLDALLKQLEGLCLQYMIPLAIVDGKSLAELAGSIAHSGYTPQVQDLLVCVRNIQEVAAIISQPGRRFLGPNGEPAVFPAAEPTPAAQKAASAIQNAWRNARLRRQLGERLHAARHRRDAQFAELQQRLHDTWPLMQRSEHVVVHVPSLRTGRTGFSSANPLTASAEEDMLVLLEAAQLARLCDLSEDLLEVLLVLPGPPHADVINYWNKILEVGGVANPLDRYKIVYPENHARLPVHMCVSAKLLSSPRAMKRLRTAVNGRPAYLMPGAVGGEEVDLAVALGIPLLGPSPSTYTALSRKSAARALFQSAMAIVPPGITVLPFSKESPPSPPLPGSPQPTTPPLQAGTDFLLDAAGEIVVVEPEPPPPPRVTRVQALNTQYEIDEGKLLLRLADTMIRFPSHIKWLFKIDDQRMGCGHAFFDGTTVKGVKEILERAFRESEGRDATKYADEFPLFSEAQHVSLTRLKDLLFQMLPKKLMIAARDVYPTYRDYVTAFVQRGGVIEAAPLMPIGSPSANLFIDPTGQVSLLSTHEKVFVYPFRSVGTTFPQSSMPHQVIAEAAMALGFACYTAGVIGHVTIDWVSLQDRDGALRLWVVDLSTHITASLMAFQLFDFLTVGTFNPSSGSYSVELDAYDGASSSAGAPEGGAVTAGSTTTGPLLQERPASGGGERAARLLSGRSVGVASAASPSPSQVAAGDSDRTAGAAAASSSQRCYMALDVVCHPSLRSTPCASFFHNCWKGNICFNVDNRHGVIFNLSDRYTSGALGVICVGVVPGDAYRRMSSTLAFVGTRDLDAGQQAAWQALGNDLGQYHDMQALVKYMADAAQG